MPSRSATIAPIIAVALLAAGCGQAAAPSPGAQPRGPVLALTYVHMATGRVGWGQSNASCALRTTDGGRTFADVTPGNLHLPSDGSCDLYALNAGRAYVAAVVPGHSVTVFSTANGGKTWTSGIVLAQSGSKAAYLDFANASEGFLETTGGGNCSFLADLYRTQNGGTSWVRVPVGPLTNLPATSSIYGGPLRFLSPSIGLLAGQPGACTDPKQPTTLYMTADGGQVWENVHLPVPSQFLLASMAIHTPIFFGPRVGLLPVTFEAEATTVLRTSDGGRTWTYQTPVPAQKSPSFTSARIGWISDGSNIYMTRSGGASWTEMTLDAAMSGALRGRTVEELDFISGSTGWALLTGRGTRSAALLVTHDGGRSWTSLDPTKLP